MKLFLTANILANREQFLRSGIRQSFTQRQGIAHWYTFDPGP